MYSGRQGHWQKIFQGGGAIKIKPLLTTTNRRIFEIWEVYDRVCTNPGVARPPLPPLADAHGGSDQLRTGHSINLQNFNWRSWKNRV